MTLKEFINALPDLKDRFRWYEDDLGQLRASCSSAEGVEHSTITALTEVQTGEMYDCIMDWDKAAYAIGLTLADAYEVTIAEDSDRDHDTKLAKALRKAVGVIP